MNRINGEILEKERGEIIVVDVDKNGASWGPYLRVKIWVNITKPLV